VVNVVIRDNFNKYDYLDTFNQLKIPDTDAI